MRVAQEPAYILHHHNYGETSLLLEVLTRAHGRLGLIAKGARRPRSPLRATLIPFQSLSVAFSGRGELPTLGSAEPVSAVPPLTGNTLFCGLYLNELLLRLLHRHDPHERLFDHYAGALQQLATGLDSEPVLRVFEKRLLEEIGYGIVLDHDVYDGSPLQADRSYRYLPERGPVAAGQTQEDGVAIQGASLLALAEERLVEEGVRRDAKRLMRALLARHLGGRPLTSRELFRPQSDPNAVELFSDT